MVGDIGGAAFDFTKPMDQASNADAKKLDQANGFSQTYTTPKSNQFCHELYGYMYPPGGNNLRAESDLQLTDPPCTTCLLYTSPSPRDVEESRMPSSA